MAELLTVAALSRRAFLATSWCYARPLRDGLVLMFAASGVTTNPFTMGARFNLANYLSNAPPSPEGLVLLASFTNDISYDRESGEPIQRTSSWIAP